MSLTRITSDLIKDGTVAVADLASATKTAISGSSASGSVSTRTTALETASGSFSTRITNATASINSISSSQATRTANLVIASSSLSSSVATLKGSGTLQSVATNASPTFAGATITGTLTAQEVHTEFESASIIFSSGSTIFGDTSDDIHRMTGSLNVSGSITMADGDLSVTDDVVFGATATVETGLNLESGTFTVKNATGDSNGLKISQGGSDASNILNHYNGTLNLGVANSVDMTLKGGSVGIGTDNPRYPLVVSGSGQNSYIHFPQDNNATSDGLVVGFATEGNAYVYNYENSNIIFGTNNSVRMVVSSSGQVGIGTATPASATNVLLTVGSTGLAYAGMEFAAGTNAERWRLYTSYDDSNDAIFGLYRVADASYKFQVNESGAVTIGSIADNGDALITNGADGGLYSVLTVQENGNSRFNLDFEGAGSVNSLTLDSNSTNDILNIMPDGTIYMGVEQGTLAKNSAHRLSVVNPSGASWISTFAYNGYPTLQLYRTNNNSPGSATANFDATSDTDIIGAINWYGSSDSAHTLGAVIDVRQDGSANTNTPTRMDFYVSPGANISAALLSLDGPTQRVGIGTKEPAYALDVVNSDHSYIGVLAGTDKSASVRLRNDAQDWDVNCQTVNHFAVYDQTAGSLAFLLTYQNAYVSLPGVYSGTNSGAANVHITSGGSLVRSTSARKYKDNIQDYKVGLEKLKQMNPITYKAKQDSHNSANEEKDDKTYAGLLADDIHDLGLSEFVEYNKDEEVEGLFYDRMVSVCINAIKELSTENDDLKKRIEVLESN